MPFLMKGNYFPKQKTWNGTVFFSFLQFFANLLLSLEDNSWFLVSAADFPSAAVGVVSVEVYEAHPALSLQTRFLSI